MSPANSVTVLVQNRIARANQFLLKLSEINIEGVSKLRNKIKQEISFLEKRLRTNNIKEEHVTCSNLSHLEAIASQIFKYESVCTSIMNNKIVKYDDDSTKKICIDLVLHGGSVWMKVIARNRKALTLVSNGNCSFGQKSIVDQGLEFMKCSSQHIHHFKPPTVVFFFASGVEDCVYKDLFNIGINVEESLEKDVHNEERLLSQPEQHSGTHSNSKLEVNDLNLTREISVTRLNLGVTTLIAYVSALTNGGCNKSFESDILKKHAEWERARPVKPILDRLFEGRELYCCQTAIDNFRKILEVLGGNGERERAKHLLSRVKVVEDHATSKLKAGKKIKERSLAIFGTGEYLKAITVTANQAFVRSALNKGISFQVFLHESRALTEGKELPKASA